VVAEPGAPALVDLTPPAAPLVSGFTADTGVVGDGITGDNTPEISGTAEAYSVIEVSTDGVVAGVTAANDAGNWTYTNAALADGSHAFTATATDAAGNCSAESTALTLVIDATPPSAPVITGITDDTGTPGDGLTNDNELILAGTAEANSIIELFQDGGSIGTTTTDSSGHWTFNHTGVPLGDGTYAFTATATDAAGNTSPQSADLLVSVDTTPPAAPGITDISDDSGFGGDGITNDRTLVLTGTAEAGSRISLFRDGIYLDATIANGTANWTFDYTGTSLSDGTYHFTATATDTAGNTSTLSAAFRVVIDTLGPVVTVNALTTTDTTPQLKGTVDDPSAVVQITVAGHAYTATNNGDGTWALTDNTISALGLGTYEVLATATDAAGNVGTDSTTDELTIGSGEPAVPVAVDSQVSVSLGLMSYDRRTMQTKMQMTITNTSQTPIYGEVWIVIKAISDPSVTLVGSSGRTSDGYLYINVTSLLGDGCLDPGEKITTWLSFYNPLRRQFNFTYSIRGLLSPLLGP
jgi:hypothetical protein